MTRLPGRFGARVDRPPGRPPGGRTSQGMPLNQIGGYWRPGPGGAWVNVKKCGSPCGNVRWPVLSARKALEEPVGSTCPDTDLFRYKRQPSLSDAVVASLLRRGRVTLIRGPYLTGAFFVSASIAPLAAFWMLTGRDAS